MQRDYNKEGVRYKSLSFMGFPNCRVGDDGSIWSNKKQGSRNKVGIWRLRKPAVHKRNGKPRYLNVTLRKDGKPFQLYVHHLVLFAFVGPRPTGQEGCHRDGNGLNNKLSNLRWDTHAGNHEDDIANGTRHMGEDNGGGGKLTNSDVLQMRKLRERGGYSLSQLGKKFGVTKAMVGRIVRRKNWKHI